MNLTDVNSAEQIAFMLLFVALQKNVELHFSITEEETKRLTKIIALFQRVGVAGVFSNNQVNLKNAALLKSNETLIADFSEFPDYAIPFAITCATKQMQADIKGLQTLPVTIITELQRELYRFNINTDICDGSKLKIYNTKILQQKLKPVQQKENDLLSVCFIALAIIFEEVTIDVMNTFFKKITWLDSAFRHLNFQIQKI